MTYNELFLKYGYINFEDSSRYLRVIYNNKEYKVDFMTNIIHSLDDGIDIAIGMMSEEDTEYKLFINRGFNPLCGEKYTSPFRMVYQGLEPEYFQTIYPLSDKEDTIVITDKNEKLLFKVIIDKK